MLAKAVATASKAKFFSISASSLTSKYFGDSEKLVRAMFAMARELQPSIIFIDEIDSLLGARGDNEHEAMRRLKTEFLLQFDGIGTGDDRILVIGATNRPQEIDEAARRRFVKRIYIPLPEPQTREALLRHLMGAHQLPQKDMKELVRLTEGYSGSDLSALAREAAMGPIRDLKEDALLSVHADSVRPISIADFRKALQVIRASVSPESLAFLVQWKDAFGMGGG
jgi:spastin